jgi:uncharacterized protein YchJ
VHHEVSHFVQQDGVWYFLDPTTDMQITMKQAFVVQAKNLNNVVRNICNFSLMP